MGDGEKYSCIARSLFSYTGRDHNNIKLVVWLFKTVSEQLKGHCVENHISANEHCTIWINKDCITVTAILNDIIIQLELHVKTS